MSERTYAATERLFDRDPGCRAFDAAVLGCEPAGDGWDVILDRTAFFPEGGVLLTEAEGMTIRVSRTDTDGLRFTMAS